MNRSIYILLALAVCGSAFAEVGEITNYIRYSDSFASAGQPTAGQLEDLKAEGFQRIVYIAYSDHKGSVKGEDRIVKDLSMEYVQIPVEWTEPTKNDFYLFTGAMQRHPEKRTLLHCQANYRASAFALLYRVLHEDVPLSDAKADMNSIWTPNETWTGLIIDILEENGIETNCEGCDWTPASD